MNKRSLVCILVGACLGAGALIVQSVAPARAQTTGKVAAQRTSATVPSDVVVKESHITLIKFVLRLRPEQQASWTPVENALRDMARWQASTPQPDAAVPASIRTANAGAVQIRLRKIAVLARRLMTVLDDDQRSSMLSLARTAGLEPLLVSR